KESQANVVQASRDLLAAFEELEHDPRLAGEISFLPFFNQGTLIENSLNQLRSTAMWGGALAMAVLFVFLRRLRLTLCVGLSIPVSALMAIAWEFFGGGSFNILTMVGVTLAIGMLVDNAVVVVENIARRRAEGDSGLQAAIGGAHEIALAVSLATLTTVVVFLPLIFMSGNPGARVIFGGIGIPLSISLMFSLLVAVVFLPAVSARVLGDRPRAYQALAKLLHPIAVLPARAVAYAVGALRWIAYGLSSALFSVTRGSLTVLAPRRAGLRWPLLALRLAAGLGVVWFATQAGPRIAEQAAVVALPGDGRVASTLDPNRPWLLAAAFALGFVLLPEWLASRRRSRPARPSAAVPTARSLVDLVSDGMRHFVAWVIDHRPAGVLLALLCLASIAIPMGGLGKEAFTQDQQTDSVRYYVNFDADFTLSEASREIGLHEDYLQSIQEQVGFDHWSCRFSETGGSLTVYWDEPVTPSERKVHEARIRDGVPQPAGHVVRFSDGEQVGEYSSEVARFELRGPDSEVLAELGLEAERLLADVPGLGTITGPLDDSPSQLQVDIDRDMALSLGVNSESALQTISWTLRGFPLPRFQEEGREVPFMIEFDSEEVAGISTLKDLQVFTGSGQVPLTSFSELSFKSAPRVIYRVDGQTTFTLNAEVEDPTRVTEITEAGYAALGQLDLPRGYSLGIDGSARARQQEEFDQMGRAFLLSIVLVFLLMGILFESVSRPFAVLFTIPFAILGAIWTLYVLGTPMDILAWIGLIILAGVVVNNGIVLIDRIHRLRGELERDDPVLARDPLALRRRAIVDGTGQRVRPVLMTAMTTIFGLLPMIIAEPATDAIDYRGLGTIVAGGLGASTFFTLWVVPLAYSVIDDLTRALSSAVAFGLSRPSAEPSQPAGAELSGSL
ncbi:MAG: efflux RND transporter permease subunit, partial [Planctomycetota bacterium]